MRIGILTYALDRPLSGISRYTQELIRAMAAHPGTPEIVLLTAGGAGAIAALDLPQVQLPGCRLLPGLLTLGNILIPYYAKRLSLDILHDMTGTTPMIFGAGNAQTIVTLYDVIPWSFPGVSTRLDTLIHRRWLPRTLTKMNAVLTISESSRRDILHYLNLPQHKVHNISGGVHANYHPATPSEIERVRFRYHLPERYILFVGSGEKRKNLSRVLEAYAILQKKNPAHKLVVAGAGQGKSADILAVLDTHHLIDEVIFTGYVHDHDLPALYSGADVFVFPSLYEGFGLPVLEAMACGTPVVTSNGSSLPEIVGDAGLMVDPYNISALADSMFSLLDNEALREELARKGLSRAGEFTWDRTAHRVIEIYHKLLGE